ncbi:MAG: putative DNA-binding domain-containing protein [Phycisphaerae bacterium]|nr:putative DNA-binding domain-containing protein [Saprospiraceae bacterium]
MENREYSLGQIQAWMQEMLVFSGASSNTKAETPLHVAPSNTLSAEQRLAIYQRGYLARLLQCLEGQYKALCHALGKDLFDDFAREYLLSFPSGSPTLAVLGERFPAYLEETRPDKEQAEKEPWVDFMVDLARFEWNLYLSFDAPGHEGQAYATPDDRDQSLRLQPCFFLSAYRFPVSAYYQGVADGEDPAIPQASAHFVAIARKNYRIGISALTAPQYTFLEAFQKCDNLAQTISQTAQTYERTESAVEDAWANWKKGWIEAGFFISTSPTPPSSAESPPSIAPQKQHN